MNQELKKISDKFTEKIKNAGEIIGAWNFGSEMHGKADELSDVDIVMLVKGSLSETERKIDSLLEEICEKVLLRWEEDFNSEAIINNGYILKSGGKLHQFDVFLLNSDMLEDFMCRIHYTGLSEKDIIFDRNGDVKRLAENSPKGSRWNEDSDRIQRTYRYNMNMAAKYILRNDYFKLNNIFRTLYETHASLLLSEYDSTDWGGIADKLKFIPAEKQAHLKKYYCTDDFRLNRDNLIYSAELFESDLSEILTKNNIPYKPEAGIAVKNQLIEFTAEIQ